MPKISDLPAMTTPADSDEMPINDVSVPQTKKMTLTKLKEYLQSLTEWVGASMRKEVVKVGTFNYNNANGDIAVTGVGFKPKAVIFFGAMATGHQSATVANFQMGFSDGVTSRGFGFRGQEASDISGRVSTTQVGWIPGVNQAAASTFVLKSLDNDGFTVTVSNNGGSTDQVSYIAFA